MLSVGRRDEGGKGIGLGVVGFGGVGGGEMEENELEEGEAYSGQEEEDATIDPDIALSYIDEKIQNVLGHFQKDFEGGVCAENLGAKFGGYGSFLPAHQRSPSILSQPRSPQKTLNHNTSRSPYNPQLEGAHQKIDAPTIAPASSKNSCLSMAISLDNSGKKDVCGNGLSAWEFSPQHSLVSRPVNCNDQKTLKVRVKVGPEKVFARNNAAIYSGLGLDVSPSPSLGESFDDSQGSSPESHGAPVDSPMMIYEFYTCLQFPPLESYILSPISKSLLYMVEKEIPQLKECKTGSRTLSHGNSALPSGETPLPRNVRSTLDKITKSAEKDFNPFEVKKSNIKDGGNDISVILKREIDIETAAGRELVTSALNIPLLHVDEDAERQLAKEAVKVAGISRPADNTMGKDRILTTDVMKEELDSITNLDANRFSNGVTERSHIKTKLSVKPLLADKSLEDRKLDILKDDTQNGLQKDGKPNVYKSSNTSRVEYDGNKARKDHVVGPAESVKLKAPQRAFSSEEGDRLPQGKEKSSSGRRKSKGGQANDVPSSEFPREYTTVVGSMTKKEKKKNLHLKGDMSDSKSKALKSQKGSKKMLSRECNSNHAGLIKFEQADDRIDNSEFLSRDKPKDLNLEYKKEETFLAEKIKEKTGNKKLENFSVAEPFDKDSRASIPLSNVPTSAAPPLSAPHVIKEHWVGCDRCLKWRLLPYEMDPAQLPKQWQCSMLDWLPGMNRCNITEEETTKALQALYHLPIGEGLVGANGHHDITSSGAMVTGSQPLTQNQDFAQQTLPGALKKKFSQKDATITSGQISSIQLTNSSRENQSIHMQSRSTDNQKNKQKERHKISERYSDGGDSFEQRGKHSKSKSRRQFDQENSRISKKIKLQESHHADDDCNSNHSLGGKTVPINVSGLSSKTSGKNSQKYKEFSTSKGSKFDQKEKSPALRKNMKAPVHIIANGEVKEQLSSLDSEKSDSAKKRKVKDWQESEVHPQTTIGIIFKEETSEAEVRKDKKVRVSKSDGRKLSASKMDGHTGKASRLTGVLLPCGGPEQFLDGIEESRGYADKDHQLSQRNPDGLDSSLKKDLGCAQPSTAATSSSSKVSGSRKSKANFQEARDSPVESVSSSPLRISNSDIPSRRNLMGKDDSIHVGYSVMGSPRRSSEGEADGMCNPFGAKLKGKFASTIQNGSLESNRAAESSVLDPTRGACDLQAREADYASKAKDLLFTKIFGRTDDEPSPSEYEEINRGDGAAVTPDPQNKHNSENQGKGLVCDQDKLDNHHHISAPNGQKKSSKSSSSRSRERHKSTKTDKGKMKASESFNDQEDLHARKNEDSVRYDTAMDSNGHSKCHEDFKDNSLEKKETKSYLVKIGGSRSSEGKRDDHSNSRLKDNMEVHDSSLLANKHSNPRVTESSVFSGNMGKSHLQENLNITLSQEDEKSSNCLLTAQMDKAEMVPGRGKLEPAPHSGEKQDSKNQASHPVPIPVKGSRSDIMAWKAANGGMDKGLKQPPKTESQNGANHNSLRNLTPNRLDGPGFVRKDGGPSAILKEARDLKHTANRLKNEGLEHESTGLYFQAALKFLHVALLLEHSYPESAKHGDSTSSIQMYSETAKLCEFCAHEHEKHKEIAASALAYKCMEVAYMKVVYFKHSSASKDRHELQVAPQMALHGESPSSSASDVDNLNNSSMVDKAVSVKGVNSPQIAGNHIIAARNRPNFMRLLGFAEDVNSAMEASKKSLNAFAAASASVDGAQGVEAMSSVKKVLDHSFHDVEGLLRLVRLSVELVGH